MAQRFDKCLECHRRFVRRRVRAAYCDDCKAKRAARLKAALEMMRLEDELGDNS